MYQIAVFQGTNIQNLEREINKWLEDRKGIKLGPVNQSSTFAPETFVVVTITILYENNQAG